MNSLKIILHKLLFLIQLFLVIIFIIFEDIIWENIAKPIYNYIHSLKIIKTLELKLNRVNSYIALLIFLTLLLVVEGAGVLAGVLFIKGKMVTGLILYISKIPLAAFTFWIFKVTKYKLLNFRWFAIGYKKTISLIKRVQSLDIYINAITKIKKVKLWIKKIFLNIKNKFFSRYKSENKFYLQIKNLYKFFKNKFQNIKD